METVNLADGLCVESKIRNALQFKSYAELQVTYCIIPHL